MTGQFDLVIIGAGPAGLAAAITGASEGLRVALLDRANELGGQARESSRIENYPAPFDVHDGFSGHDLAMGFSAQAEKFGAAITAPLSAIALARDGEEYVVTADSLDQFRAPCVLLAMGLQYRRLEADGMMRFLGRGVTYGAPPALAGRKIAVVGGANSAGQAIERLSQNPRTRVTVVSRAPLAKSMSSYLHARLLERPNVEILERAEVRAIGGTRVVETISIDVDGQRVERDVDRVAIFIGAVPHTGWLHGSGITLDERGFLVGGPALCATTLAGVYCAGDVRAGQTVKRITGAVFDGVCAIMQMHRYLSERSHAL